METKCCDIVGYEGLYSIYSDGRVFGQKSKKLLKANLNCRGYCYVHLCKEGKIKKLTIHRLVATHFLQNKENKEFVDHIDGNKQNNCVENLRWATKSQNRQNGKCPSNNTSGEKNVGWDKKRGKWYVSFQVNGKHGFFARYETFPEAVAVARAKRQELYGTYARDD